MKVFLKTLKWDLDHDPSNGSLSKFNQVFILSLYISPASFVQIGSVVFARSCSQTHRHTHRQTDGHTEARKHTRKHSQRRIYHQPAPIADDPDSLESKTM